jgi:hypothetical protein
MANRQRGEVSLKIGGTRYRLKLTTNAVCELEDFAGAQTKAGVGRTWDQVLQGIDKGSLKDVRLFFWVALRTHHSDIATDEPESLKVIGNLIDEAGGLSGLVKQMTALIKANTDTTEEEEAPKTAGPSDAQGGIGAVSAPTH